LTKTARAQGQTIMGFRDVFRLIPASEIANVADVLSRNEILTPNEMRSILGRKPSTDPNADKLQNRNMPGSTASIKQNGFYKDTGKEQSNKDFDLSTVNANEL